MTPTRQEFMFFSTGEKVLFYALIYASLFWMFWQYRSRARLWMKGRPLAAEDAFNLKRSLRNFRRYILEQKEVRSSRRTSGAPMHLFIFYGFLTLTVATTLLGINTYSPIKFHKGLYFLIYEQITDWMGLVFILGVLWALARRLLVHTGRLGLIPIKETPKTDGGKQDVERQTATGRRAIITSSASDYGTLLLLLVLALTGFWVEATRISVDPKPWDWTDPIGGMWGHLQGDWSTLAAKETIYKSVWWFHAILVMGFFTVLPRLRINHVVMAVLSTAGKPAAPMGKLRLITIEEVEKTERVGAKTAADYSRWHLLSLDACMECGRCTEVCPAYGVGKILNPKEVVQDVRGALKDDRPVAERVSEEALWACTTCNACVEACPVLIRHVDLIVDARRHIVSEGGLSGSAATMLRQSASTGHAWGAAVSNREDWMQGLEIPLCRDGAEFEWLFWVGCAGATDSGAVRTTKAVAGLLKKAGVNFACLGKEEACTGDPARRIGEEFLFQEQATKNATVFARYGVKRIVTACPHCLNTLKHEYPDLDSSVEVLHHTQLLSQLIAKGSLVAAAPSKGSVVLHDPCYLARVNDETEAPRSLLANQVESPVHSRRKTLCCGAGGGRMWMEESPDQRPGNRRSEELLATGAETVAVACPFCRIMLGDSLKQSARPETRLVDLAELLVEANVEGAR
jgi:Fe-S oxidoreductase